MRRSGSKWQIAAWLTGLALVLVVVCLIRQSYSPDLPARGDALYDYIVAKQILQGRGLRTNLMPLGGLRVLDRAGLAAELPWPSVHKFVGSQWRVAASLLVFRKPVPALLASSLVPYGGLLATVFLVLRKCLASSPLAFVFAAGFIGFNIVLRFALSGLNITGDALLFLFVFLGMLYVRERPWVPAALGVTVGVSVLHRYSMSLLVPFCVLGVAWSGGLRRALHVAVPSVTIVGAFMLWSRLRFGLTFPSYLGEAMLLHRTPYLEQDPWYVLDWPNPNGLVRSNPEPFVRKWLLDAKLAYPILAPSAWGVARNLAFVALAAIGVRQATRESVSQRRVLIALGAFAVLFLVAQLALSNAISYLVFLLAPAWLFVARGVIVVARRARARAPFQLPLVCGLVVGLLLLPEVGTAKDERDWFSRAGQPNCMPDALCNRDEVVAAVRAQVPDGAIVAGGTLPWEIAAGADVNVIPLVPKPDDLLTLREKHVVVDAVFLPAQLVFSGDGVRPDGWLAWRNLQFVRPERFFDFELKTTFQDGSLLYVRNRSLAIEPLPPFCPRGTALDMRRPSDVVLLSREFGPWEIDKNHAWSWLRTNEGTIRAYHCDDVEPKKIRVGYMTTPQNVLDVTVNGVHVGQVAPPDGWNETSFSLPPALLRRGENQIRIVLARKTSEWGTIALERIAFD
jgi:hypothetical protein